MLKVYNEKKTIGQKNVSDYEGVCPQVSMQQKQALTILWAFNSDLTVRKSEFHQN